MGACYFESVGTGTTLEKAYHQAVEEDIQQNGMRDGYNGSLYSARDYLAVTFPKGLGPKKGFKYIEQVMNEEDYKGIPKKFHEWAKDYAEIGGNKWSSCLAIKVAKKTWVFFGYAPE